MISQRKQPPKQQIADAIRARIGAGEWAPGALLPPVRDLAEQYACAVNTAGEALKILRADGLIVMRPRQGSIVAVTQRSVAGPVERLNHSRAGALYRSGDVPEILSARLREAADAPDAAAVYGITGEGPIGVREYVIRDPSGAAITYGRSYFSLELWDAVPELQRAEPIPDGAIGAIRRTLQRETFAVPTQRSAEAANAEEARVLGVEPGSPVLAEVTECQLEDGTVVEWALYVHPRGYRVGR